VTTSALEEMTEQLRRENDTLKDDNKQLAILLDKIAVNNENQIQQINSLSQKNRALNYENEQFNAIKDENTQLKAENNTLKVHLDTSASLHHSTHFDTKQKKKPKVQKLKVSIVVRDNLCKILL